MDESIHNYTASSWGAVLRLDNGRFVYINRKPGEHLSVTVDNFIIEANAVRLPLQLSPKDADTLANLLKKCLAETGGLYD